MCDACIKGMTPKSIPLPHVPTSLEGEILDGQYALTEARSPVGEKQLYAAYDLKSLCETMVYVSRAPDGTLSCQPVPTLRVLKPQKPTAPRPKVAEVVMPAQEVTPVVAPKVVAPVAAPKVVMPRPEVVMPVATPKVVAPAAQAAPTVVPPIPASALQVAARQPMAAEPHPLTQRKRLHTGLLEAAWFAHGDVLEDEEEAVEELVDYPALQASLETAARELSADDYQRYALNPTTQTRRRKREDDTPQPPMRLPRLLLGGVL
ncbi:MAG: hypothetical protein JRH20_03970 [Deltaproteobacteria bacterium]|nr:hypothetical protein [Deltaproteobacteria bacterium]